MIIQIGSQAYDVYTWNINVNFSVLDFSEHYEGTRITFWTGKKDHSCELPITE